MRRLRDLREDSGQVLVVTALCMVVLIAFIGLAVDIGAVRYEKRHLQVAADAAALAASLEVRVCGDTPSCAAMQTAAQNALSENNYSGSQIIINCAQNAGTGLTLMVNNSPCLNAGDPNSGKMNYVETQVSETAPVYFSRILGVTGFHVSAHAEAARGLGGPCIYALNPTAAGSLSVTAGLGFQSKCGIVVESNSPAAVTCLIGGLISAPEIRVTGGTAGLLCGSTPAPTTGVAPPSPADPLAYLPAPSTASDGCGSGSGNVYNGSQVPVNLLAVGGNVVFNPGVYCGGITITAAVLTNITFNPGIYILRNGNSSILGIPGPTTSGLTITLSALSSITGNGVMFYNEGNAGSFSITGVPAALGLSNFNLTAPKNGEYGGILFFQAHGVSNTGTFLVNLLQGSKMDGVIYMPDALVTYALAAVAGASTFNGIVADRVQFTAQILSTFGNDYSSLQNGSPMNGDQSELVQ